MREPCVAASVHALVLALLATTPNYSAVKSDLGSLKARAHADFNKATTQKQKTAALAKARAELLAAFDQQLFPIWSGTPWNFYGTTETPKEGTIACGYFVSTLMRDAGFDVERVKLAQQASEYIVKTLAEPNDTLRFRNVEKATVIADLRKKLGDGLFVVGMDYHVAFLRLDGARADLCHAAVFEPKAAVCEDAAASPGFTSNYHVVGRVFSDAQLTAWLAGQSFPTKTR